MGATLRARASCKRWKLVQKGQLVNEQRQQVTLASKSLSLRVPLQQAAHLVAGGQLGERERGYLLAKARPVGCFFSRRRLVGESSQSQPQSQPQSLSWAVVRSHAAASSTPSASSSLRSASRCLCACGRRLESVRARASDTIIAQVEPFVMADTATS